MVMPQAGYEEQRDTTGARKSTARTDRDHSHRGERPAKQAILVCSIRGRYLRVAGDKAVCTGDNDGQYRPQNTLQIAVLLTKRAMRAVLLPTLAVLDHLPVLSRYPHPTTRVPSKPP